MNTVSMLLYHSLSSPFLSFSASPLGVHVLAHASLFTVVSIANASVAWDVRAYNGVGYPIYFWFHMCQNRTQLPQSAVEMLLVSV